MLDCIRRSASDVGLGTLWGLRKRINPLVRIAYALVAVDHSQTTSRDQGAVPGRAALLLRSTEAAHVSRLIKSMNSFNFPLPFHTFPSLL